MFNGEQSSKPSRHSSETSTQEKEYHRISKRNIVFNLRFAAGYHGTSSIAKCLNFTFFIFISFFILYKYYNINFLKLQDYLFN